MKLKMLIKKIKRGEIKWKREREERKKGEKKKRKKKEKNG